MASNVLSLVLLLVAAVLLVPACTAQRGVTPGPDICQLAPLVAIQQTCRAILPRFTYNATLAKCVSFGYGGCGGSANLFHTLAQCEARCARRPKAGSSDVSATAKDTRNRCLQPPAVMGPCEAAVRSFSYVPSSNTCREFVYGGCGGNRNNFPTRVSCINACVNRDYGKGSQQKPPRDSGVVVEAN